MQHALKFVRHAQEQARIRVNCRWNGTAPILPHPYTGRRDLFILPSYLRPADPRADHRLAYHVGPLPCCHAQECTRTGRLMCCGMSSNCHLKLCKHQYQDCCMQVDEAALSRR
jgi:hypothetical protein